MASHSHMRALLSLLYTTLLLPLASSYQEVAIDKLESIDTLRLTSVAGPESLAFDPSGEGPYTGVSGGQILKWQGKGLGWAQFAFNSKNSMKEECIHENNDVELERVCGRPLGLQFHRATGVLYIADAYLGLLAVGPGGGPAIRLAAGAEGAPFHFTNGVDVDQETGMVYFTDSSTRFRRPDYLMAVLNGDSTGRLLKYDPRTKKVAVLRHGLPFPNGVALTSDRASLLVAETGNCRVVRYWLRGPRAGEVDVFANLVGYPDNIKRTPQGEFWVAINMEKVKLAGASREENLSFRNMGMAASELRVVAVKLSRVGKVLKVLNGGIFAGSVSEVVEKNETIWIGSVDVPYVGVYRL